MRKVPVLAVALLLLLAGCGAPVAQSPADDAVREPSRPDPRGDVQGWENGYWYNESISVDGDELTRAERAAVVARAMARVERIRDVEFERDVPVTVISRAEYREQTTGGGGDGDDGDSTPSPAATFQQVRYEALMLLGSSTSASEQESENDAATVQGYYSPSEDRIVIVSDDGLSGEIILSQELFHAYQFRHLIPRRLPANPSQDRLKAWISVVEGDANLVDARYAQHCRAEWECLGVEDETSNDSGDESDSTEDSDEAASDSGDGINMGLYLLQYFPYAEGEQYVRTIQRRGGWDAVDAEYESLPNSTEQVIHVTDDPPGSVSVPTADSDRWTRVREDDGRSALVVGEAGIATMFASTLYDDREGSLVERSAFLNLENGSVNGSDPLNYGIAPADGWAADRMAVYRDESGETAFVWRIRWESVSDAREFASAYRDLLRYYGAERVGEGRFSIASGPFADEFYVHRSGATVTVVNAPSEDDLVDLYDPAGR